jgi:hypothetical protein
MNQQTLMEKLEECKHYDKDNRYDNNQMSNDFMKDSWQQQICVLR